MQQEKSKDDAKRRRAIERVIAEETKKQENLEAICSGSCSANKTYRTNFSASEFANFTMRNGAARTQNSAAAVNPAKTQHLPSDSLPGEERVEENCNFR
jgi:hypothetical protein